MRYLIILLISLMVSSCELQQESNPQKTERLAIVSVELFHAQHQSGVFIIVSLNSLEIFLKPTGQVNLELPPPPPPPPPPASDSNEHELKEPGLKDIRVKNRLEVELIRINNEEREILNRKIQKLQGVDLESSYNFEVKDGSGVRIDLVYNDLNTKKIILLNDSTENQREFLKALFEIVNNHTITNKGYLNSIL